MKIKKQITEIEQRLERIRKVNQRIGYRNAVAELEARYFSEARKEIECHRHQRGMPFEDHEIACRKSRMDGFETGVLVGTENTRAELREFYEKQRREYESARPSPLIADPILSAWEMICVTNATQARGDS